ncbi:MAG: hypothetical protein BGO82_05810 [Devosia sp. 67-54]|uniref:AsmA family protein n=1 Tax=unclassified Devosia TaxID=196773 RepID=UPI000869F772|nr:MULTISPECIES: AsmA family protein [unclassified Devosia]MBN9306866.1 AsmA family protein [Devosia sp.]ODU62285.1 MAG: hypothetical protein ABT13_01230 [Pelagibacterium sp. SCN 68-10]OJX17028.1 MAG: hypothetical protein BGO82_05810 [Devosia sp. 67-54]
MLNRLFIAIGVLVILAIGAAFVVPRFIQWGDYRDRLQTMAAEAFGTEVAIEGDIHLTLLPAPKLEFTRVRVGPASAPVLQVGQVDAEFSLLDFLRDQYKVTSLTLNHPTVNLAVAADGSISSGIAIAGQGQSNVSIANANVESGSVHLTDMRSGAIYAADGINGQLKLDALKGPFSFQGNVSVDHAAYAVRVSTTRFDDKGSTTLALFIKADNQSFTLDSSGTLTLGAVPKYAGDLTYRAPPPRVKEGDAVDAGRGDFVLTGKVDAGPDRVLLSDYVALPDENRAATRLTGAGELKLGKAVSFNAIVSGGVVALPPRDATKELTDPPYELVRLLGELPLPPIPPVMGTVGLDIAELNLRAVSLRDVRLEASTDTKGWTITDFAAALPGATRLGLTGTLGLAGGKPVFTGGVTLDSTQLDRLAALWRRPAAGDPLLGQAGSLKADVALSGDTLTLGAGTLVVGGINQGFDAQIGFGQPRRLKLDAHFTTLGPEEGATLAALLPDLTGSGSFGATFPKGEIDLSAGKAALFGLDGTNLDAHATWEGGVLEFQKLSAEDFGGAQFDARLTAFGTLAAPELSGTGMIKLEADAPLLDTLLGAIHTPPAIADFLHNSLPADLNVQLDAPAGDGGQVLNVSGRLSASDTRLEAKLGAGIANALVAPIAARLTMSSQSSLLMTRQLGLGARSIFGDGTPLQLDASIEGVPANSYETHVRLAGGDDHISFDGNVIPGDFTRISGTGGLDVKLGDPQLVAELLGAGGVYLPPLAGTADLDFSGTERASLSRIAASGVSGNLALARNGAQTAITGSLALDAFDVHALLPALAGAASTVPVAGSLWPGGPIDIGAAPRTTTGRIEVTVAALDNGVSPLLSDVKFGYDWDAQSVHLRNLSGDLGGGTLGADITVCCSNAALPDKQVSGRLSLAGVGIDTVAPAAVAGGLDGTLEASAQFDGSGATLDQAIAAMTGTGSYTVSGFSVAHFDPGVFRAAGALTGVVDLAPEALSRTVTEKLEAGPFSAPTLTGSFTIANGTLRSPNLAIAGDGARIFGSATMSLKDLVLDAHYTMSPTGKTDATSAIDPTTAEVDAVLKGPLWAPATNYDVAALVDGMKIKANEIELARLEQLKAEADARAKAAAELRARLDALRPGVSVAGGGEAMKLAEEAAAIEAARKAAEAAKRAAASSAEPLDLGL